jgi:hypothetical protein
MAPTALTQTVAVPLDTAVMARTGSPVVNTILNVNAALAG